jgi:hypothetical protein
VHAILTPLASLDVIGAAVFARFAALAHAAARAILRRLPCLAETVMLNGLLCKHFR